MKQRTAREQKLALRQQAIRAWHHARHHGAPQHVLDNIERTIRDLWNFANATPQ